MGIIRYAHHGMKGTDLPPMDTGVKWTIGGEAVVTWQVENNHGGGYSYRLCPIEENLTEACFQAHHLEFATDQQGIVFQNGTVLPIQGVFVTEGTTPPGSMWSMIPLPTTALGPRCIPGPNDTASTPNGCEPWEKGLVSGPCKPCPETPGSDCSRCDNNWKPATPSFPPHCEGCSGSTHTHAIKDVVKIPATMKPGKYVLGWRYDCEATAQVNCNLMPVVLTAIMQVWSNCADIELIP